MVSLLKKSSGAEMCNVIEREFEADSHVRGNRIPATEPGGDRPGHALFDELLELMRKGPTDARRRFERRGCSAPSGPSARRTCSRSA